MGKFTGLVFEAVAAASFQQCFANLSLLWLHLYRASLIVNHVSWSSTIIAHHFCHLSKFVQLRYVIFHL